MQTSAAVCAILFLLPLAHSKVVKSFVGMEECKAFFYKGHVPKLGSTKDKHICQRFKNKYHFATLYDTQHRIPVYSAYILEQNTEGGRDDDWMIEPQLTDPTWKEENEMMDEKDLKIRHPKIQLGRRQALDEDYKDTGFDRGHLNPNGHHGGDSRKATFTLTNVVPQNSTLNQRAWRKYEEELTKKKKDKKCDKFYVLVGAIPSQNWTRKPDPMHPKSFINRVNIPSDMWNAYCCVDANGKPIVSGAAWVENRGEAKVERLSVEDLTSKLRVKWQLFKNNCIKE